MASNQKNLSRDKALNMLLCGVVKRLSYNRTTDFTTLSGDPEKPFLYKGIKYAATEFTDYPRWSVIE